MSCHVTSYKVQAMGNPGLFSNLPDDIRNDIARRAISPFKQRCRICGPFMQSKRVLTEMSISYVAEQLTRVGYAITWNPKQTMLTAYTAIVDSDMYHVLQWGNHQSFRPNLRTIPKTYVRGRSAIIMRSHLPSSSPSNLLQGMHTSFFLPLKLARQSCFMLLDIHRLLQSYITVLTKLFNDNTDELEFHTRVLSKRGAEFCCSHGDHNIHMGIPTNVLYCVETFTLSKWSQEHASLQDLRQQSYYSEYINQLPRLEQHYNFVCDLIAKMDISKYDVDFVT